MMVEVIISNCNCNCKVCSNRGRRSWKFVENQKYVLKSSYLFKETYFQSATLKVAGVCKSTVTWKSCKSAHTSQLVLKIDEVNNFK